MPKKKVAVIVQSSKGYGRGLLAGISSFARTHRTWSIYHDDRILQDSIPEWLERWNGDGMIASFDNKALAEYVRSRAVPAIDLQCGHAHLGIPSLRPDDSQAVEMAYNHLRQLGHKSIGYCGFQGIRYSEHREAYLRELCSRDAVTLSAVDSPFPHAQHHSRIEADGLLDQENLLAWLRSIETPIGIVACNDIRASQVLNAIRSCDYSVPEEVAVVGMDNDACVCGLCDPALSSVDLNAVHIGFQAAESLNCLMQGGRLDFQVRTVTPAGVIERESSSLLAITDEEIAQAARFIAENASTGITVHDVVAQASISRSALERRFKAKIGRSIKSEINRIRLMNLKELLSSTDYPMEQLAGMVGFAHSEYMITFFKKAVGTTPGEYRKEHRLSSA